MSPTTSSAWWNGGGDPFAPTLVGTVYGMNFQQMPELTWALGYPMAVFLMLTMGFVLYLIFKRRHWL